MSTQLEVGDLITIVAYLGNVSCTPIVRAIVVGVSSGIDCVYVRSDARTSVIALSLEGIEWTRGHHALGTPDADALLAAYNLWRVSAA